MRYEVSVKASYVPNWGIKDAFREFVSNAFDAELEMSAKATVRYSSGNQTLYVENDDVVVPREALLFGHTTKHNGREGLIGQFGEGLKLACLAAVREGYKVRIRSGSEVWVPSMVESRVFPGVEVLGFDIQVGRKESIRTVVEIAGFSKEQWDEFRKLFIRLDSPSKSAVTETPAGSLIDDLRYAGRVYVRGVLVQFDPRLQRGYDLKHVTIDRDRKMINTWDRDSAIQSIWTDASKNSDAALKQMVKGLFEQSRDLTCVNEHNAAYVDSSIVNAAAEHFVSTYGKDAVPVVSLGDSKDLEHLGKTGVVVPKAVQVILSRKLGTLDTIRQALHEEVTKTYSWSDIPQPSQFNLNRAIELVNKARPITIKDIDIVDFRSDSLQGQYKGGRILVAAKILKDLPATIKLLVHERAHSQGHDGEKSHVQEIENTWADVVRGML